MLTSIEIKNFKSIKNKYFPLRNLNVLTGLNNSGKSCLIDFLLLLEPKLGVTGITLENIHQINYRDSFLYNNSKENKIYSCLTFDKKTKVELDINYLDAFNNLKIDLDTLNNLRSDNTLHEAIVIRNIDYYSEYRTYKNIKKTIKDKYSKNSCNDNKNKILIIDKPELFLHPKEQSDFGSLLADLAFRDLQIFVETHSDHVINAIRVEVKENNYLKDKVIIFNFEKEISKDEEYSIISNIEIDKNGSLSQYPIDFLDEWSKQLCKLL